MIIAIDPGASGGIAWLDDDGTASAEPMPEGMSAQADFIRSLAATNTRSLVCWIERVGGYMPGNSGPASVKFARHCGHLEAICYCIGLPVVMVAPQTWMKSLGSLPKDKHERKVAIKEVVARRFPNISVTLKTSDALGILAHAMEAKP